MTPKSPFGIYITVQDNYVVDNICISNLERILTFFFNYASCEPATNDTGARIPPVNVCHLRGM